MVRYEDHWSPGTDTRLAPLARPADSMVRFTSANPWFPRRAEASFLRQREQRQVLQARQAGCLWLRHAGRGIRQQGAADQGNYAASLAALAGTAARSQCENLMPCRSGRRSQPAQGERSQTRSRAGAKTADAGPSASPADARRLTQRSIMWCVQRGVLQSVCPPDTSAFCSILPGVPAGEDERESVAAVPTSARSARQGWCLHTRTGSAGCPSLLLGRRWQDPSPRVRSAQVAKYDVCH